MIWQYSYNTIDSKMCALVGIMAVWNAIDNKVSDDILHIENNIWLFFLKEIC